MQTNSTAATSDVSPTPIKTPAVELAADRVIAAHQERIARLCYRLLGWRGEVDDVVQDVFVTALMRWNSFRGEAALSTWLAGIAINRCRAERRRSWWRRPRGEPDVDRPGASSEPGKLAAERESALAVQTAIRRLPQPLREVVVLRIFEQMPARAVAELLGLTTNAVDLRLNRAKAKLRALLGELEQEHT
ncbi:MAG: ECF RNA polymerase sigma factor SigW [Phycisphaerae bacterium]|nr:ECF RNA polymerase sigma factor SigW [Phycisphaerae bacterium]